MPVPQRSHIPHVLLLGGAPSSGKSTLARHVGLSLGCDVVSTDDISCGARAMTTPETHPALHPMAGVDYRRYYVERSPDDVWNESLAAHRALWPAVRDVIAARRSFGRPAVVEGWALLPALVSTLDTALLRAVYLVADDALYERRVRAQEPFYRGASDEEALCARALEVLG
jgi:2-phosphoglycerate kinase